MRRAAPALLAALALAGCGGGDDGGSGGSATRLLERGFATDVGTGFLTLEAEMELEGGPGEGAFRLELEGPFRAAGSPTEMPDVDMAFRASGAGQELEGRVVLTRANAWVEFRGETYELGEKLWTQLLDELESAEPGQPETFAEAGVDPLDWVTDAEETGQEDVGGTRATKVTGRLDAERMLRDFNRMSADALSQSDLRMAGEVLEDVDFEALIGADHIWRRVSAETDFTVPEDERDSLNGLESGNVSLDVELDEPNQPVEIEGPAEARPVDELLRRLGLPPELLLGPGFAQPAPG